MSDKLKIKLNIKLQPKDETHGKDTVIAGFQQLITHTQNLINSGVDKTANQFKLTNFRKTLNALSQYKHDFTNFNQLKTDLKLSDRMMPRVIELVNTGKLKELETTLPSALPVDKSASVLPIDKSASAITVDKSIDIISQLLTVHGIGEVSAKNFVNKGIVSVDDLIDKVTKGQITVVNSVKIGLQYYYDINQKIPFDEIAEIKHLMMSAISSRFGDDMDNLVIEVCGSHRRQKALSGDIDVLITHKSIETEEQCINSKILYLQNIVKCLKDAGLMVADLTSKGNTKFMGVCKHPVIQIGRRIDIRFVPYNCYYPSLLYFTGSMELNKKMRQIALDKGYTLNEYGLYKFIDGVKGEKLTTHSEQDIFTLLDMEYLEPNKRDIQ